MRKRRSRIRLLGTVVNIAYDIVKNKYLLGSLILLILIVIREIRKL